MKMNHTEFAKNSTLAAGFGPRMCSQHNIKEQRSQI